jgi:hypothetical protein
MVWVSAAIRPGAGFNPKSAVQTADFGGYWLSGHHGCKRGALRSQIKFSERIDRRVTDVDFGFLK